MKSIPPVYRIKGYGTGNTYIVEGGEGLVIIDTGVPRDYMLIVDRIKSMGRSPVEVSDILLTHFHLDHAGSAAAFKRLSHAKVYAHAAEVPFLQGDESMSSVYRRGVVGTAISLIPAAASIIARVPPVDVDVPCEDGQVIDVLGGIRVIHAPGHTPGSAVYFWEEKGILFTGDAMINTYHVLTLPTNGFSVDFDQAARSIAKVVDSVEDEGVWLLCTGHGPMVDEYAEEKLLKVRGKMMKHGRV
jgi:glyoxylase-like metal-dependent hydrolase (beta-lactamase superfamily II)